MHNDLDDLLKTCNDDGYTPSDADLALLANALATSESDNHRQTRATAYIILGVILRHSSPQDAAHSSVIIPRLTSFIADRLIGQDELQARYALHLLDAIFHVDGTLAANVLLSNELVDDTMDVVESFPTSQPVLLMSAKILSQAAGRKQSRELIGTRCISWLQRTLKRSDASGDLKAATANALLKLSLGHASQPSVADIPATSSSPTASSKDTELVSLMRDLVLNCDGKYPPSDVLEGLAHASAQPSVKEALSKDTELLTSLFSLAPEKANSTEIPPSPLLYGLAVIINNLVAFRPRLSEQDSQIQQLRQMASKGLSSKPVVETEIDKLDDDDHVRQRTVRLIKAGCLAPLRRLPKVTDSAAVRQTVARAYLSIIETKELRGFVLQTGGSKTLLDIIAKTTSKTSSQGSDKVLGRSADGNSDSLETIQALAKLCITASPQQVFGPDGTMASSAVHHLILLLLHNNATLLQKFEALMALTNLATLNENMADQICRAKGLWDRVEYLLLADHELVRRAAVELLCNLVGASEDAYGRFGGTSTVETPAIRSKIHVLLALSDVEDVPTRLAAAGVLAIVSRSTAVCDVLTSLQADKGRVVPILARLLDDSQPLNEDQSVALPLTPSADAGLFLRGITCVANVLDYATERDASRAFTEDLIRVGTRQILIDSVVRKLGDDPEVKKLVRRICKKFDNFGQ